MLVPSKLAIVTYEMHEPYNYGRLWELIRAEGLESRLLSETGVWTKLPNSTWAAPLPSFDVQATRDGLAGRLNAACSGAGLNVDVFVAVCDGWAWSVTEGKPPPSNPDLLEALGGAPVAYSWLTLNEGQVG